MQLAPSGGQFFNSCKWRHLVAIFATDAGGPKIGTNALQFGTNTSGITWWSNFELIQAENIQLAKFGINSSGILFSWTDNSS